MDDPTLFDIFDDMDRQIERFMGPTQSRTETLRRMARLTDLSTSHDAAESMLGHLGHLQQLVHETHLQHPDGLTDWELSKITGLEKSTASKRRGELVDKGILKRTNDKRPTNTGRKAWVWCLS